jgi:predicted nuclease with TOPRIM domain
VTQVLTHLKEKLQFVQKENEILGAGMESLEYGLTSKREHLQKLKVCIKSYTLNPLTLNLRNLCILYLQA